MRHRNNIGVLRLILASLVIISHAYILLDIAMAEPLARHTGIFTIGAASVDGFFLLSGYLITQSMTSSSSHSDYIRKRILRIYPAFVLAYVIGGLVAAYVHPGYRPEWWRGFFLFHPPEARGPLWSPAFTANAPMWTIGYEFRCYLGILILSATGLLGDRRRMLWLTLLLSAAYVLIKLPSLWQLRSIRMPLSLDILIGNILPDLRFFALFSIGMLAFLFRDAIMPRLTGWIALLSAGGIALTIANPLLGESLFMPLGAIILFWLAFRANIGPVQRINDRWDISYGTYLYGWPIGNLLVGLRPEWNLGAFIAANLIGAWLMGALSWFLLERFVNLKALRRRHDARAEARQAEAP